MKVDLDMEKGEFALIYKRGEGRYDTQKFATFAELREYIDEVWEESQRVCPAVDPRRRVWLHKDSVDTYIELNLGVENSLGYIEFVEVLK